MCDLLLTLSLLTVGIIVLGLICHLIMVVLEWLGVDIDGATLPSPSIPQTAKPPRRRPKRTSGTALTIALRPVPICEYIPPCISAGDAEPDPDSFLFDENMCHDVPERANRMGLKVQTVKHSALVGLSDPEILRYAHEHRLVVVTHDKGFRHWTKEFYHCGVLICRQGRQFHREIVRVCLDLNRATRVS